ncbi:hypothetical protein B7P43_G16516 [Cryptotermes secundus]|uniref:DUF4817 domain-containing protein n=1 Tax=Cryptotermes secundus TaxID=105785 RepID=A0A2J7PPJ9_9NEOP|nr:hypothetical protein B7P43_G16516 [Cryptotermes secundus]
MASPQQKAFCVLEFAKTNSVVTVQRAFRRRFGINPPCSKNIRRWFRQFQESGCLCKGKSPGRPRVSEEQMDFFLWGYVKDHVYVPPLPTNLNDLKNRITTVINSVHRDILIRAWEEYSYRIDVARAAGSGHIEHF